MISCPKEEMMWAVGSGPLVRGSMAHAWNLRSLMVGSTQIEGEMMQMKFES